MKLLNANDNHNVCLLKAAASIQFTGHTIQNTPHK